MKAVVLKKPGGYANLIAKEVSPPKTMRKNDIVIRQTYVGVNFDDILVRKGIIELPKNETGDAGILGFDAVGVIERIGSNITRFKVGQRVGYGFAPIGAYCERRVIDANFCIAIPDDIMDEHACAILRKGLTAHTMLFRCHVPRKDQIIVITGAGSGVGQMIARWAKYSGVKVIGAVSNNAKKDAAMSAGCDIVVNYTNTKEAIDEVAKFTNNYGVHAVYDGVGNLAFEFCIKSLQIFGTYISYGNTSGNIVGFDPLVLENKSLFFTKPRFEVYKSNRNELVISAHELFTAYKRGAVLTNVARYSGFATIQNAHRDLESRQINGSVVVSVG